MKTTTPEILDDFLDFKTRLVQFLAKHDDYEAVALSRDAERIYQAFHENG